MIPHRRLTALVAFVVVLGCAVPLVRGQDRSTTDRATTDRGYYPSSRYQSSYRPFTQSTPSIDPQTFAMANAEAAVSRVQLSRAEANLTLVAAQVRNAFEASPEFRDAQRDLNAAQETLDAARKPVLKELQSNPDYKRTVSERDRIARVLTAGELAAKDRFDLAIQKLNYSKSITQMEADALSGDAKVRDAQERVATAGAKVNQLRTQFEVSVPQNPQFVAARRAVEDARLQYTQATAYLYGLSAAYSQVMDAYYYQAYQRRYYPASGGYDPYGDYYGY